ncbi:two-component system regulatory protein YycI [Virgibacillus halodenitrificans]|uniref:two-component system regulatory protein YycI n=1 Tax=Virgibacillus halodenitrificans TaxID=1482 RepID=UPI001FB1D607|nr:two-component system regulatory protein YycI [Virgibacillus halodenitrificans]MCJ0931549.1 two-component system regulatory protein YycI [Virgibacillus halodenitrificans]
MQWNQIKTLFILCFLILDVYLLMQFMEKQERADVGVLTSQEETSFESKLEQEDITISDNEVEIEKDSYISVLRREYSDKELSQLADLDKQYVEVIDKNLIVSKFEEPIAIPDKAQSADISKLVKSHIIHPEDFTFWGWNKDRNALLFFQEKENRPIYFNENGMLLVYLNKDNEMEYYTQTMLGEAEEQGDLRTLTKPMKAIEILYNANELYAEDNITNTEIGYHTRIPLANGKQVFAPTYKITVNDERNYFINAIEGHIFASNDTEFIGDAIQSTLSKIKKLEDEVEWKDSILQLLNQKLQVEGSRGEE